MDKEIVDRALDALERLMRMFRVERFVYLICAVVSFLLLIYAGYIMFATKGVSAAELGLMFGATGLTAVSAGRVTFFLNKSFNLIEAIVRKIAGLEGGLMASVLPPAAPPAALSVRDEIDDLVALERQSRRTTPVVLGGLLAIAFGFVALAGYLHTERASAQQQAAGLSRKVAGLAATLNQAKALVVATGRIGPVQQARLSALLADASVQVADLDPNAAVLATPTVDAPAPPSFTPPTSDKPTDITPIPGAPAAAPDAPLNSPVSETGVQAPTEPEAAASAPRILIRISADDQRAMAERVASDLAGLTFDDRRIVVVPEIRLGQPQDRTVLSCLTKDDCARAGRLAALIEGRLARQKVGIVERIGEGAPLGKARGGTFELAFANGPILLKSGVRSPATPPAAPRAAARDPGKL